MPFTPSHAVVALPFLRSPLVPAAIAVGAMTPDLPLFVRTGVPTYEFTHSLPALPATVLLALALLLVWRCALRPAVGDLSPHWLAERLPSTWDGGPMRGLQETFGGRRRSLRSFALLVASLLLGVVSHILWDLFTHEGRWGVSLLPVLADQWGPMPGYKWAQHGSSVLGLIVLGVWGAIWLSRRRSGPVRRAVPAVIRWAWWLSLPIALVIAWVIGLAAYGPFTDEWTVQHLAYRVHPVTVGAWGAATAALAIVITVVRASAARGQGTPR